ncbi:hypothetical protein [Pseudoclavibacter helvolus]|uniref:hypothetical protein n=1 Tax=Pseudoclavibacter helvolus TaxID=255205 RepID=UPI003736E1DF
MREGFSAVVIFIGPAAAGTLKVLFDDSSVLWITAATSLLAALVTLLIPQTVVAIAADDGSRASATSDSAWPQLRAGWRALFHSPSLVATTALSLVSMFVLAGLQCLVLPVHFTLVKQPGILGG